MVKCDSLIFLVGPTAIGKSEIAARLAKKLNAEIISCDSMQIYKGMEIIASHPPLRLTRGVPHHLIGTLSPSREYNVSRYRKDAVKAIAGIIKRGKVPLFVGGTGLYMSLLIDGIFSFTSKAKDLRNRLYRTAERKGNAYLYKRLQRADPEAALKIHPNDTRRIVRALEVFEATGKPISLLQKQRKGLAAQFQIKIFCVNMKKREELYQKIDRRVERMCMQGAVREVKKLLKAKLSKTARYAIGIKEIKGYLAGEYDLPEVKRLMKRTTRLYAKRQLTWFRKDKRIRWIEVAHNHTPRQIAEKIWNELY